MPATLHPEVSTSHRADDFFRPERAGTPPEAVSLSGPLRWLVAVPVGIAALLGAVAALFVWTSTSEQWTIVLLLLAVVVLAVAAAQTVRLSRQADDRVDTAHTLAVTAQARAADAPDQVARLQAEVDRLTGQLRQAEQAPPPAPEPAGRQQVGVFVNLSRRLQSLVHREIMLLDALENEVEDPDLLKGLFQVDHLATRIRRHAENLAVLGGAVSRRQWSRPVALTEVLRSAIAEVEHYSRVKLVPPIDGTVPGYAVAGVIHLVAELIENATMFAPPETQVLLRVQHVAAGIAVDVEDRGLGMQPGDRDRMNRLLAEPESVNLEELLGDGRIGLFVVSTIARQYGIAVQLQSNVFGGTQAVVILPNQLLTSAPTHRAEIDALPAPEPGLPERERTTVDLTWQTPQTTHALAAAPSWPAFQSVAAPPLPSNPVAGSAAPEQAGPPLPRRRGQTHMAPQLQHGPAAASDEPDGDHDTGLMASFLQGMSRGDADIDPGDGHPGRTTTNV